MKRQKKREEKRGRERAGGEKKKQSESRRPSIDPSRLRLLLLLTRTKNFFTPRSQDEDDLREALRHAAATLGELRTSLLAPKTYFELHLRVTGELDGLARFFDARARRGAAAEREARKARRSGGVVPPATTNTNAAVNAGPPAPTSLAALYDLVQHAGNVLPRLYLLVTVGAARARASREREEKRRRRKKEKNTAAASNDDDDEDLDENEPPAGAILADVAEMCRGVQHPVRGLFLRAYLLQATRGVAVPRGEPGARFLLANFAEANKLWVRLGYLTGGAGSAAAAPESSSLVNSLASVANTTAGAARAAREAERRQLADLVGKNITLLSQLEMMSESDDIDNDESSNGGSSAKEKGRVELYQRLVLPSLLEQVVGCRDAAAQAYLTQAIVQCFPDDHHVATLDALLAALPALAPGARVAGVYGALLDRLAHAAVERADKEKEKEKAGGAKGGLSRSASPVHVLPADGAFGKLAEGAAAIAARAPDLPAADVASLYASLARYARALPTISSSSSSSSSAASSSSPSSSSLPRVDAALAACRAALDARGGLPPGDRAAAAAVGALLCLPVEEAAGSGGGGGGVEATLSLPAFPALLASLPAAERRRVASRLAAAVVASERSISDAGSVSTLLRFVAPLVRADGGREEKKKEGKEGGGDAGAASAATDGANDTAADDEDDDDEAFDEEQALVARMIHRLRSDADVDAHYAILGAASEALACGGAARSTRVLPPLAFSALDVAARAAAAGSFGDEGGPRKAPPPPGEVGAKATARGALQFVSRVASSLADAGQAMAASAAAAEEGGSRGGWGTGGGGGSTNAATTSRKAAAAADAVTAALGLHLAAATLASAHAPLADDASDAFEQAFLLYEDACPPDSASQRGALRALTAALASAAANSGGSGKGGLSREALDSLAAKAASCASRLLRKADQCRALCAVAHVYWQGGGGGDGEGSSSNGDGDGDKSKPAPFRDAARALSCMQRALKAATAASAQAAVSRRTARGRGGAVEAAALHVEVLDHYLRLAAAGAAGFGEEGTLSALRELVAGEVVGSEEAAVRGDKELLAFYESTLQKEREGGYGGGRSGGGGAEAGMKGLKL